MSTLEVNFVRLSECVVCPGYGLALAANEKPGIHYNLVGRGRIIVGKDPPIDIKPHTLLIVPPGRPFRIEVDDAAAPNGGPTTIQSQSYNYPPETPLRRYVAGEGKPEIILICGYFQASYGASVDLFANLPSPIVELFEEKDHVDHALKLALAELVAQEVGSGAMTTALMKQVMVSLLRRSLNSSAQWVERFAMLSDPQIARAFSDMVARPGAPHSIQTLCHTSGLSRSAFMSRFAESFGKPPMLVLRQLRMRHAAILLSADSMSVEQVAAASGYSSRSSFFRAFRKAHGSDPSHYRATLQDESRQSG